MKYAHMHTIYDVLDLSVEQRFSLDAILIGILQKCTQLDNVFLEYEV